MDDSFDLSFEGPNADPAFLPRGGTDYETPVPCTSPLFDTDPAKRQCDSAHPAWANRSVRELLPGIHLFVTDFTLLFYHSVKRVKHSHVSGVGGAARIVRRGVRGRRAARSVRTVRPGVGCLH